MGWKRLFGIEEHVAENQALETRIDYTVAKLQGDEEQQYAVLGGATMMGRAQYRGHGPLHVPALFADEPQLADAYRSGAHETSDLYEKFVDSGVRRVEEWSRSTVRDLQRLELTELLSAVPDLFSSEQLSMTVPDEYRGAVKSTDAEGTEVRGTSEMHTRQAQIVAIDKAGVALVWMAGGNDKSNAQGWDFTAMPKQAAFSIIDDIRAGGRGEPELSVRAEPGATYIGPIVRVGLDRVVQEDRNSGNLVRHDLRALVGDAPSVGQAAEVRYPHGTVGLIAQTPELRTTSIEQSLNHDMRVPQAQQEMER